ncbi:hypothetical protein, conserved [Trypanosoma brucei gambiense DAL972]|uniref:RING-type domain-containing protein n=1 Tax=Trypanosoma brucei gambiense (strain MHOM/CI/86/DAL972) TaxID=679716 RepID=C9ZI24_TRYB9|nr:hypothetical protein, conserved [Trypanosoma brucei gambiense DAL972]CBH09141.1 hypothetical protein, conserved [Trypanosoma brucei gambiense DAL972]|eukprot:XP_011771582.1 hypothetical protein, conserved [Trypanosoma brucei gambiense DAL972]
MYSGDRAELQRLRTREAELEEERKALAAMRAELESRIGGRMNEIHEMEEKVKGMWELEDVNAKLREELDELREVHEQQCEKAEEKLRNAMWELTETQRKVQKFAMEVRNRSNSISICIDSKPSASGASGGGGKSSDGKASGSGPSGQQSGFSIEAELCEAWNCVDKLCVACLEARVALEAKQQRQVASAEGRAATKVNAVMELLPALMAELEDARRQTLSEGERMERQAICGSWGDMSARAVENCRLSHERLAAEEGRYRIAFEYSEWQERCQICEAVATSSFRYLAGAQDQLKATRIADDAQQKQHDMELNRLRAQMKEAEDMWNREVNARQRAHESALLEQQKWHDLAMREAQNRLMKEWETEKESFQQRINALDEERSHHAFSILSEAQKREEELHKAAVEMREAFEKSIAAALETSSAMLERYEFETRAGLLKLEHAERSMLRDQEREDRESKCTSTQHLNIHRTTIEFSANILNAAADFRLDFPSMMLERTKIVVDNMKVLHDQRLREVRRRYDNEMRVAASVPRELAKKLEQELEETKCSLRQAAATSEHCEDENRRLTEQIRSLQTQFDERPVAQEIRVDVKNSLLTAMHRLIVAEEATECIFSCGLCMQPLKSPLTCVPCGHTFCEECLLKHPRNVTSLQAASQMDSNKRAHLKAGSPLDDSMPGNKSRNPVPLIVRYCPDCAPMNCSSAVRVQVLDSLSGNLRYRKGDIGFLRSVMAEVEKS